MKRELSAGCIDSHEVSEVRRLRLLILEHEVLARWGAAADLRALGHRVIEAHTVNEAIAVIESGTPIDVVFCDSDIPGPFSGFDFEAWLSRNEPSIPVLVTSVDPSGVPPMPDRIARAFIAKPYSIAEVAGTLEILSRPTEKGPLRG